MTSSPYPSRKCSPSPAPSVVAGSMTMIPHLLRLTAVPPARSIQRTESHDDGQCVSATQYQGLPASTSWLTHRLPPPCSLPSLRPSSDPDRRFGLLECLLHTEPCISLPVPDRGLHLAEPPNPRVSRLHPPRYRYDEATGYVWVAQTRNSTVSVVDPSTKECDSKPEAKLIILVRVRIDSWATVALFGSGGISVFDTTQHTLAKKIEFTNAKGRGRYRNEHARRPLMARSTSLP